MRFNGKKLKQIRLEQGLRQSDISERAKQLGLFVDSRTLSNWENSEKANPRPHNVAVVAKVLNIRPEELYILDGPSESSEKTYTELPISNLLIDLGYAIIIDGENVILRSSGRTNDLQLSFNTLAAISQKTEEYLEFLLYKSSRSREQ